MRYEDTLYVGKESNDGGYDEEGYAVAPTFSWNVFGKCFLSFNSSAQRTRLSDGKEYQYSYYVITPLKKDL